MGGAHQGVGRRRSGPLARALGRLREQLRPTPRVEPGTPTPRVLIIGAGFSGIGMAIRLKAAGVRTFTVLEKGSRLGGTWRDNTYPGAACDIQSHLYCFSFAPKADWSRKYAEQPEILAYLERCAEEHGLGPHLRFGVEVERADLDEVTGTWRVRTTAGEELEADVLVAATGQLNRPNIPEVPGRHRFAGTAFHSARWDHEHPLDGEDVAVIGNGASAIQFVPRIAERARSVTIYQRSTNYVGPKSDRPFRPRTQRLFRLLPPLERLHRAYLYVGMEWRVLWFRQGSWWGRVIERRFRTELAKLVSERLPERAVVPDYPLGCKRLLISNDWYPTLLAPHVHVVVDPIEEITPTGVVAGGVERPASTLIWSTGFRSTEFLAPIEVRGVGGRSLQEAWRGGARAHLGIAVAGFPNLALLYGPNTNLGHNSILLMVERQIDHVVANVVRLARERLTALDVRPEVMERSTEQVQRELAGTVWVTGCSSWYVDASGRVTNNWPGSTLRYWWQARRPRRDDYAAVPASTASAARSPATTAPSTHG